MQHKYGIKGIEADAPTVKSVAYEDGKAVVTFNCGPLGVNPMGREVEGFELAGEDRVFHPAKAKRKTNDSFLVWSEEVTEPVAVRYCFRNWCVGTVFNAFGIPVAPFRTDDWQL